MTLTNPKNNETLTSPFATDLAAKDALFAKITAGDFSRDPAFAQNLVIDARSVSVGYGPICADRYNLPWGAKTIFEVADRAETIAMSDSMAMVA